MKTSDRVVYSINIEDIQAVAEEELDRELTPKEIKMVEDKIGDYIDWFGAISSAIKDSKIK